MSIDWISMELAIRSPTAKPTASAAAWSWSCIGTLNAGSQIGYQIAMQEKGEQCRLREIIRASYMLIFRCLDHKTTSGFSLTELRGIETLCGSSGRVQ